MDTYVDIYSYMGMTKDMDIHENGHRNGHGHITGTQTWKWAWKRKSWTAPTILIGEKSPPI
jgi:hypothetical protein